MSETRFCKSCEETKPVADFARLHKNGQTGWCRKCDNARVRDYQLAHPEKTAAWHAQYYRNRKANPKPPRTVNLRCPRCERPDLTREDFHWNPSGLRDSYCKVCKVDVAREWRAGHPEVVRRTVQRNQQKRKLARLQKVMES